MNEYWKYSVDFFVNGGPFMWPLAICSLLAGAAVVYKILTLRRSLIVPDTIISCLEDYVSGHVSLEILKGTCEQRESVLSRLVLFVVKNKDKSEAHIKEMLQASAKDEFVRLQSGIPLLDTIINIAPMFGILGTASGLVIVFSSFGETGNQPAISSGIAQALNTTIVGLAIAAPSVVAHMYFARRLEKLSTPLELLMTEFVDALKAKHS